MSGEGDAAPLATAAHGAIVLSATDLALAASLVLAVAALSLRMQLGLARPLVVAALRAAAQLLLIGLVLRAVFAASHPAWVAGIAAIMLLAAGHEARARQRRPLVGLWGYGLGVGAMFAGSFTVAAAALSLVVEPTPWYAPQYAIPILGMLLGNTLTGVSLATDRVSQGAYEMRAAIEQRLMLGETPKEATRDLCREALRAGMMPIINGMAAAGIVSLPGMMTGQILAGSPPLDAVRYQILILFLIAGGTGLGSVLAVALTARRLFDARERLRLDRLAHARDR
jgi:putative ABC transport system permease protein